MAKNTDLLSHLRKSTIKKYNVEGTLFKLFPLHILKIYKIIMKLHNLIKGHKDGI